MEINAQCITLALLFFVLPIVQIVFYFNYYKKHSVEVDTACEKQGFANKDILISQVIYILFAILILLFFVLIVWPNIQAYPFQTTILKQLVDTGVIFALLLIPAGLVIDLFYWIIKHADRFIQDQKPKGNPVYTFTDLHCMPKTANLVFACILFTAITFQTGNIKEAFLTIALILGKFLWLDFDISKLKEQLLSMGKNASKSFSSIFLPSIAWAVITNATLVYMVLMAKGAYVLVSFILGLLVSVAIVVYLFCKKEKPPK